MHDLQSKAPVPGEGLYARCVAVRGPVPSKPSTYSPNGKMIVWFDFELRGLKASESGPVPIADFQPGSRVSQSATWPWDTTGFPPFVGDQKKVPTEADIDRYTQPINWGMTAAPNGKQTLAGILVVLGGKVNLPNGAARSNFAGIIGKMCKVDMNKEGTYVHQSYVDSDQHIWKVWEDAPAPAPEPVAARPNAVGAVPPDTLPEGMYRYINDQVFKPLRERGLDAGRVRALVSAKGATSLAHLDVPQARDVLVDIGGFAAASNLTQFLPALPEGADWVTDDLRSYWSNLRGEKAPPDGVEEEHEEEEL